MDIPARAVLTAAFCGCAMLAQAAPTAALQDKDLMDMVGAGLLALIVVVAYKLQLETLAARRAAAAKPIQ